MHIEHFERDEGSAIEVATVARLLRYSVRRSPGWTALLLTATAASVLCTLLSPLVLARAVDAALAGSPMGPALILLAALIGTGAVASVVGVWAAAAGTVTVAMALRRALTLRVLLAGLPGQRRFTSGDLTSRVVNEAATASQLVPAVLSAATAVVLSVGGIAALALIYWPLAVAFLVCVPVAVVLMRRFVGRASGAMMQYQRLQGILAGRLIGALAGSQTIRASGTVDREVDRVLMLLPEMSSAGRATWQVQRHGVWKISLLTPLTEIVVFAFAGFAVSNGQLTVGHWAAVAGYVAMAVGFLDAADTLVEVAQTQAGARRLAEVLALRPGPGGNRAIPDGPGEINFRSVTMRGEGEVLLDGVEVLIPAGVLVAIVGRSGAGKSTFAALAGGLLAPDEGQVLLDGVPLTDVHPDQLRRLVAYAFERPAALGKTVHDMIAYGSADLSRQQVERAAGLVCADTFIRRLPDGYDTLLSRAAFSGGELQRLGLARAIVRDPRILILDDATSSLDTATEAEVTATLNRVLAGRTRVLVAHRVASAANADLVLWLEDGQVQAIAPHDRLWDEPSYRAIFAAEDALVEEAR